MAELFDITDALEILSKLGEPDLLDRSAAALKSLQESSYSEFVVEHRRIQLLSQSADEEDRDDALRNVSSIRQTVSAYGWFVCGEL